MAFPDLFKLDKLKIAAFSDRDREKSVGEFEAMFNPTTIAQRFGVNYAAEQTINNVVQQAHFVWTKPANLNFTLLLDGTGVDQIGLLTLFGKNQTVSERIADFLKLTYHTIGESHEPSFLTVTWGKWGTELGQTGFRGRLSSVDIRYNSFARDGSPMRAELDVALVSDDSSKRQLAIAGLSSPDVTHSRLVREGDTLPLLTRDVYGSSRHVLEVARVNGLDHFRSLEPGRELVFPPIAG